MTDFYNWRLVPLNTLHPFHPPLIPSLLAATCMLSVSVSLLSCVVSFMCWISLDVPGSCSRQVRPGRCWHPAQGGVPATCSLQLACCCAPSGPHPCAPVNCQAGPSQCGKQHAPVFAKACHVTTQSRAGKCTPVL